MLMHTTKLLILRALFYAVPFDTQLDEKPIFKVRIIVLMYDVRWCKATLAKASCFPKQDG